jgi:hypothetical protein
MKLLILLALMYLALGRTLHLAKHTMSHNCGSHTLDPPIQ